jgi:hypothetical protein
MNEQKIPDLRNYLVIRNVIVHGIMTDDGVAFPAMPELKEGVLNVWSCAGPELSMQRQGLAALLSR